MAGADQRPVRYAKLVRPRVHDALPRPRLYALLDALRATSAVIWITAPPGSGKTTLAASYLAERAPSAALWYQVDQADSDPATLLYYLRKAIAASAPVPLQESELGNGDERAGFTRLFFRDFYNCLPAGAVLVFDNLHELDAGEGGQLLEIAFSEVPADVTIIALSRAAPPARLARIELSGRLHTIGWDQIRLNQDEAQQLAGVGPGDSGGAWLELVDGWAAGLVMLRNLQQPGMPMPDLPMGRDAVFRYFAGEIFERLDPAAQRLLMLLSALPGISAGDALRLTGEPAAPRLLDQFYRQRLFVDRRGANADATFHFHLLFREFLQHEAALRLAPGATATLLQRAAALLEGQGRSDEAAQLYASAAAHPSLRALLVAHASAMIATGRGQRWREWLSWLPADLIDAEPVLLYWHGVSLNPIAPLRARSILQRAEQVWAEAGDGLQRALAIAAIVDSFDLNWGDPRAVGPWGQQLAALLPALLQAGLAPELELRLNSRLVLALLLTNPDHPDLAPAAQRCLQLLASVAEPVDLLAAGAVLLRYFDGAADDEQVRFLLHALRAVADDPAVSPFHRVWWFGRVARWYNRDGNYEQAQQVTGAAKHIVADHDLDPLLFQFLEVHHLLGLGALPAARTLLDTIAAALPADRPLDRANLTFLDASWRALHGELAAATRLAQEALRAGGALGMPVAELSRIEVFLACCYAQQDGFDDAERLLAQAQAHAYGYDSVLVAETGQFLHAYRAARAQQADTARALLRDALGRHAERQAAALLPMFPQLAGALAALALDADIAAAHVRAIVVRQRLAPPHRLLPGWPWPVAVHTLASFTIAIDGVAGSAHGKSQHRPHALLKALIAAGEAGKQQSSLALHLWPDVDDAKAALNVTVHRLRKLLGNDQAIRVHAGRVVLNHAAVWVDADALVLLCDQISALAPAALAQQAPALAHTLLDLYRGPFCDGDTDPWLVSARERLRSRFLAAVSRLGEPLEAAGDWNALQQLYVQALQADPFAELLYRGLMRCAHARRDPSAAFGVYRRCRETLSIVLGRKPSPETEQLAVELGLKS